MISFYNSLRYHPFKQEEAYSR